MRLYSDPITILYADDDRVAFTMLEAALDAARLKNDLRYVQDGVELLDYLYRRGDYADSTLPPRPGIILLDLNMPRMDGREALSEIKKDDALSDIPIVVLTSSDDEEDIARCYRAGASSYITKPVTFDGLAQIIETLGRYWFQIVDLPLSGGISGERQCHVKL